MKNLKKFINILTVLFVFLPLTPAYAVPNECELWSFNNCLFNNNTQYCAKQAITECKVENHNILWYTTFRSDCKALAHKNFFWTDSDTYEWNSYGCCQRTETENCYIRETSEKNSKRNGFSALEYCALEAASKCQKDNPRSTQSPSIISINFLIILCIILMSGLFLWFLIILMKAGHEHKLKLINDILKEESMLGGRPITQKDISYSCTANYYGGYPKYPGSFTIYIFAIGSTLYFQRVDIEGSRFRVELKDISNIGVFAPFLPYVMNLNAAGVLANEMTRRQFGNNVFIEFKDGVGLTQTITFGEFKNMKAEAFVSQLHSDLERLTL